jgi:nucleoside-diphosphate-sugar epimerase
MRVFLAGATGVIGTPLVPLLLEAGHEVTAMTRSVLRAAQLQAVGADPVVCDVFDADGVRAAMAAASPDAVIHQLTALPARLDFGNPTLFDENNRLRTEGTRVLVDAALASGASRIVAQSIAFAYAPTGDRVKEEDAALFTDAPPPIGGAVAAVVELERRITATPGIEGLVLRYGMLYGPGTSYDRRGSTAADIIAARIPLVEGATGLYSWLHVEDAASAAVAALGPGRTRDLQRRRRRAGAAAGVAARPCAGTGRRSTRGGADAAPAVHPGDVAARCLQREGQARAPLAVPVPELARRLCRKPCLNAEASAPRIRRPSGRPTVGRRACGPR